jgi:AcrR family transcriptional regulator
VAVILEAAAQLFQRYGYDRTTTNKIADRAGVSIGSLYQYFPNKDALLVAVADDHVSRGADQLDAVLARAAEQRLSLRVLLDDLVRCMADLHTDRPGLHRLLFDLAPRTPELAARFRQAERRVAAALGGELHRLGAGGTEVELNALLAVQGIGAQIHGMLLDPSPAGADTAGRRRAIVDLWHQALIRQA